MSESRSKVRTYTLTVLFGAILVAGSLIQIGVEWRRGERIQAVDLFRYAPRNENLRRFERELEGRSWLAGLARSAMREMGFALFGEPGPNALLGNGGWLFYRPGIRYLIEAGGPVSSEAIGRREARAAGSRREHALNSVLRFRDALLERGIQLLVTPVPGKASVYPDRLTGRYAGRLDNFRSPSLDFIDELRNEGVEVLDLFSRFEELRASGEELYLAQDTHWTPRGAEWAAMAIGERLLSLGWLESGTNVFGLREVRVKRRGDIVEMTQVKGLRRQYPGEVVTARQVIDLELGLMVPSRSDRPGVYRDPRGQSRVLLLGDSFSRVFQYTEPQTSGERIDEIDGGLAREPEPVVAARLYPGSAGLASHLALALSSPVDAVISDGGATTDVRRRLSVNPEILEGKKVVVWEFVERDIRLGEWLEVPLPRQLPGNSPMRR